MDVLEAPQPLDPLALPVPGGLPASEVASFAATGGSLFALELQAAQLPVLATTHPVRREESTTSGHATALSPVDRSDSWPTWPLLQVSFAPEVLPDLSDSERQQLRSVVNRLELATPEITVAAASVIEVMATQDNTQTIVAASSVETDSDSERADKPVESLSPTATPLLIALPVALPSVPLVDPQTEKIHPSAPVSFSEPVTERPGVSGTQVISPPEPLKAAWTQDSTPRAITEQTVSANRSAPVPLRSWRPAFASQSPVETTSKITRAEPPSDSIDAAPLSPITAPTRVIPRAGEQLAPVARTLSPVVPLDRTVASQQMQPVAPTIDPPTINDGVDFQSIDNAGLVTTLESSTQSTFPASIAPTNPIPVSRPTTVQRAIPLDSASSEPAVPLRRIADPVNVEPVVRATAVDLTRVSRGSTLTPQPSESAAPTDTLAPQSKPAASFTSAQSPTATVVVPEMFAPPSIDATIPQAVQTTLNDAPNDVAATSVGPIAEEKLTAITTVESTENIPRPIVSTQALAPDASSDSTAIIPLPTVDEFAERESLPLVEEKSLSSRKDVETDASSTPDRDVVTGNVFSGSLQQGLSRSLMTLTSPPTTPTRPTDTQRQLILDHVAETMVQAHESQQPLTIRLAPPDLGPLLVQLHQHEGAITARLEAATAQGMQLLVENLPQLQESLQHLGMTVERIEIGRDESRHDPARNENLYDGRSGTDARPQDQSPQPKRQSIARPVVTTPTNTTAEPSTNAAIPRDQQLRELNVRV